MRLLLQPTAATSWCLFATSLIFFFFTADGFLMLLMLQIAVGNCCRWCLQIESIMILILIFFLQIDIFNYYYCVSSYDWSLVSWNQSFIMVSPSTGSTTGSNITTTTIVSNGHDYMFPHTLTTTTVKLNGDLLWLQSLRAFVRTQKKNWSTYWWITRYKGFLLFWLA